MYNEARKREFITVRAKGNARTAHRLEVLFDNVSRFEEAHQCDFAEMDVPQTEEVLNAVTGMRMSSIDTVRISLKAYVRWCKANGMKTSNSIKVAEIDVITKVRSSMVASPAHLKQVLDIVFPNPDEIQTQFVVRAYLWLAFMGLRDREAVAVKGRNLDFAKMELTIGTVNGEKKVCPIYAESAYDLAQARDLKEFRVVTSNFDTIPRKTGQSIIRGALIMGAKDTDANVDTVAATLRPTVSRAFKNAQQNNPVKYLSYKKIYLSGVFYRAYECERMGHTPSFDQYAATDFDERQFTAGYKLSETQTEKHIKNRTVVAYEQDYIKWKLAFT